jgi:hypothetical protein
MNEFTAIERIPEEVAHISDSSNLLSIFLLLFAEFSTLLVVETDFITITHA